MVYVERHSDGRIKGVYAMRQGGYAEEWLDDGTQEVLSFLSAADVPLLSISHRQFYHVLALDGLITEAEALTAVKTGDPPAAFETLIASLPEGERFSARMLLEGATTFERNHPLTNSFGTMHGMSAEQIDDLWRRASVL